jgi:hypothetical protein
MQMKKLKPFPKFVSAMSAVITGAAAIERSTIVAMFGGGALGESIAAAVVVLGVIMTTLSHSLTGTGGKAGPA